MKPSNPKLASVVKFGQNFCHFKLISVKEITDILKFDEVIDKHRLNGK